MRQGGGASDPASGLTRHTDGPTQPPPLLEIAGCNFFLNAQKIYYKRIVTFWEPKA